MVSINARSLPTQFGESGTGFTTWICSLNFFLSVVGYPVAMSLLAPWGVDVDLLSGGNTYFTWSVRAVQILVAGIALISVRSLPLPRLNWRIGVLAFFWALYLLRALWDLEVRSTPSPLAWNNRPGVEFQAWCYILPMALLPMIATLKGFSKIDFRRVLNWIVFLGGMSLVASLFAVQKQEAMAWRGEIGRAGASAMLNTIAYGHLGLTVGICALFKILNTPGKIFRKSLLFCIGLLGAYIMLRAGSRGPMLACFIMFFVWALTKSRYAVVGMGFAGLFAGGVWLFIEPILEVISKISPVLSARVEATLLEGDTSGRDTLVSDVWDECLKNPLTGFQLDFLGYSHNVVLDGVMMFGLIFGWIVLVLVLMGLFSSYKIIKFNKPYLWLGLLLIQQLVAGQTSGMFGSNSAVQCLLVVVFLLVKKEEKRRLNPSDLMYRKGFYRKG